MAALENQTKANVNLPLYASNGSGGGSSNLDASTLTLVAGQTSSILEAYPGATRWQFLNFGSLVSEIRLDGTTQGIILDTGASETAFEASTIFTNAEFLSAPQITVSSLNANYVGATEVDTSTISTSVLDIDGQLLTATPSNLLLNGIPIATTSNISSLADWALEPAISSVNMSGFDLLSTGTVFAQSGVFTDLSTITFTAQSTIHVVSTISSLVLEAQQISVSTLFASAFLSTPDIETSSINGAVFGSSSITVEVIGVSSLVANSISSLGAEIRTALVSTLQFNPSFSPSLDVNLGLGSLFGNLAGAAAGGIGVLVGAAGLGTGIAALAQGRQTNYINSNAYELVNGTTQLQISTLGTSFSTVYRFVSSVAENVPGEEYFVSTIYPPGQAIRSLSDPLNTVSSPNSTIQSFGQWVSLADLAPVSTVSTFANLYVGSMEVSSIVMPSNGTISGTDNVTNGTTLTGFYEVDTRKVFADTIAPLNNTAVQFDSPVLIAPSTTLWSQTTDSELVVGSVPDSNDFAQVACSALRLASSTGASNGVVVYSAPSDRLVFLDGTLSSHTLAYTVDSNIQASSIFTSSITVQGQVFINPSTTASGVYMPFDPTNGTGVVAIGLSTGSIFNKYAFFGGIQQTPLGEATKEGMGFLQTTDAQVSFQYADLEMGRALFTGSNNYGTYTSGYITGDGAGNLSLVGSNVNCSNLTVSSVRGNVGILSTLNTPAISTASISFNTGTLSSLMFVSTAFIPGTGTSTTTYLNTDVSIGQNDFYCGQLRVGALSTAVQAEVIIYQPDGGTKALNVQDGDRTLRIGSSALGGVLSSPGYILDTFVNPPFFSTLAGTSTALMAFFPSTSASTIGVSTLSVVPPQPAASFLSRSTQTVAANTPLTLWHEVAGASVGSAITQSTNTLVIGQAGVYDIETSIQFDKTGGGVTAADFWFRKNGVDIPDSASQITIQGNTGECLGNVSIFETFAAGDKLEVVIASADNTLGATFFQSTVTTPYTRPAVPSIITNIKKLG